MLFILHRIGIVILSTKTTVTLVSVDVMKMNTINLNFPSPRSEPREVIEVGFVHEHVKVLMIYLQIAYPLLGDVLGQMPTSQGSKICSNTRQPIYAKRQAKRCYSSYSGEQQHNVSRCS